MVQTCPSPCDPPAGHSRPPTSRGLCTFPFLWYLILKECPHGSPLKLKKQLHKKQQNRVSCPTVPPPPPPAPPPPPQPHGRGEPPEGAPGSGHQLPDPVLVQRQGAGLDLGCPGLGGGGKLRCPADFHGKNEYQTGALFCLGWWSLRGEPLGRQKPND